MSKKQTPVNAWRERTTTQTSALVQLISELPLPKRMGYLEGMIGHLTTLEHLLVSIHWEWIKEYKPKRKVKDE
jgi:hypothetical protein